MIDIQTIFLLNTAALFVLSIYLFINRQKNKNNRIIKFITFFALLYFLGFTLILLRNKIPDFLSIVIANSFLATGSVLLYVATRAILGLDSKWHLRYWLPSVIIFVGFMIFTYIDYDTVMRVIIFYSFATLYSSISAWLFWFHATPKFYYFDKVSALMFLGNSLLCALVVSRAMSIEISMNFLSTTDVTMVFPIIFMSVLVCWLIVLVQYRIKGTSNKH